jgi:hypothetical protein
MIRLLWGGSIGGRFARKERESLLGAGGQTAEVLLPFGRPAAAAQVQHADALDRVTDVTEIEVRCGRTLFAMDAKRIG